MSGATYDVGVEIEFTNVTQAAVKRFLREKRIDAAVTNDASCMRRAVVLGDDFILTNDPEIVNREVRRFADNKTLGGEIVTGILDTGANDDWQNPIVSVLGFLQDNGEVPNLAGGIHVHVSTGTPRYIPTEVLRWVTEFWARLEAPIFRITQSYLGYNRGEKQLDSIYCRPLVPDNGPAVVRDERGFNRPCFEIRTLLQAKTTQEFMMALTRSDLQMGRYWAPKYHALNFYSLYKHGTIELRTPNFTSNPDHVVAWIMIAKRLVQMGFRAFGNSEAPFDLDRPYLPLGYAGDYSLSDFLHMMDFNRTEYEWLHPTLEELWNLGSWSKPVHGYIYSHLGRGIGARMPETRPDWSNVPDHLVPRKLDRRKVTINSADDFIGDRSINAFTDNHPGEARIPNPFVINEDAPPQRLGNNPVEVAWVDDDEDFDDEDFDDDDE